MHMELHLDKVAMVSGASRGIGREIALELARRGYRLSLGLRNMHAYDGVPDAFLHPYEARDPYAARAWVDATIARFGRIDVLVSNAGICRMIDFDTGTDALLTETFEINVNAPFRLVQAALPHLRRAGSGRFVQLASLSGKRVKNLNVGYQINDNLRVYADVGNVFDKKAPIAPASYASSPNYLNAFHMAGLIGRTYKVGVGFDF